MSDNPYIDPAQPGKYELLYDRLLSEALELLHSGARLTAWWDAGGDQAPGAVEIVGDAEKSPEFLQAMYWTIVRALDLPGAGFTYDKGKGELFEKTGGSLAIRFSSVESGYGVDIKRDDEVRTIPFRDPCGLWRSREKGQVYLSCDLDYNGEVSAYFNYHIREGDNPVVPGQEEIYKQQVGPLVQEYADMVLPRRVGEGEHAVMAGGTVEARLRELRENEAEFDISFYFTQIYEHVGEEVVIITASGELGKWPGRKFENY